MKITTSVIIKHGETFLCMSELIEVKLDVTCSYMGHSVNTFIPLRDMAHAATRKYRVINDRIDRNKKI
jgi:hypothetical protein